MKYKIRYLEEVYSQLKKIPKNMQLTIRRAIDTRLTEDPYRFKPLVSNWRGYFRMRVGDYRVIYTVEDETVTVLIVRVDVRGKVYE